MAGIVINSAFLCHLDYEFVFLNLQEIKVSIFYINHIDKNRNLEYNQL